MPEEAYKAGAAIVGTGRSDFANQVNNVLAFPGIFKGALSVGAKSITPKMRLAAAYAIAESIDTPTKDMILPQSLDKSVVDNVARVVAEAWEG